MIRRGASPKSYMAKVVAIGHECDLAELSVDDDEFWEESYELYNYETSSNMNIDEYIDEEKKENDPESNVEGLNLGDLPELHQRVTVIGYPTGGDNVSVTRGVVSRIEPQQYAHSIIHKLLAVQIDAAINAGNSGGPALDQNNNVVGVAFQSLQGADNIGYIIPTPVINHFIEDVQRNGKYLGFLRLGVQTLMLDHAYAAREYYKMKKNMVRD